MLTSPSTTNSAFANATVAPTSVALSNVASGKLVTRAQAISPGAAPLARQAKLADAAQQFEGLMLQELLKPMQSAGSVSGNGFDGEDQDPNRDTSLDSLSSYGVEAMATALARGGGVGIAKQVMRQIGKLDEKTREKSSSTKVSDRPADTFV